MEQIRTIKDFYTDHLNKVMYSIFNNQTLIDWKANGGDIDDSEVEKAKVSIEKDQKWADYLKKKLDEVSNA